MLVSEETGALQAMSLWLSDMYRKCVGVSNPGT